MQIINKPCNLFTIFKNYNKISYTNYVKLLWSSSEHTAILTGTDVFKFETSVMFITIPMIGIGIKMCL